jgi:hypothetical protein
LGLLPQRGKRLLCPPLSLPFGLEAFGLEAFRAIVALRVIKHYQLPEGARREALSPIGKKGPGGKL